MERGILGKMFLDIHIESCNDKGEGLLRLAELGKPFSISPVPVLFLPKHEVFKKGIYPSNLAYPKEIVDTLKKLARNKNVIFGQQGFFHYCTECFKEKEKKDSWHENMCLYGMKSLGEQIEFMFEGKRLIEEILGISPVLYVPPNHQYDKNSIIAAQKLGFDFFAVRKLLEISPYKKGSLVVLPESRLGETGEIMYTHYDEMINEFEKYLEIVKQSSSLNTITPRKQSLLDIKENYKQMLFVKKRRDEEKIPAD